MIDAQAHVPAERSRAIIPPGKLAAFLMVQAKRIRKSPAFDFVERSAFSLRTHDPFLPQLRIVNVAILRRHIEVAAKNHRRIDLHVIIEKQTQASHPVQFKIKLF